MYDTSSSFSLFSIGIELTEKGLQHVSQVVELVFAYVRLLHEADTAAWLQVYEEEKAIHAMNFAFKSKETPMSYTSHLAADMHVYAAEEVLTGGRLYWQFDEPRVRSMLRLLSQDNMIVQIVSRDFAADCQQTEPWYDTRFAIRPWSEDEWSRIEKPQTFPALHLPHKNEFIATDFTLKQPVPAAESSSPAAEAVNGLHEKQVSDSSSPALPVPSSASPRTAASLIPPVLLSSSGSCELWWKADTTFLKPKANVLLKLCSPLCHLSPTNAVLTSLFCRLLEDELTEYSYDADIAGLAYSLSPLPTGLSAGVRRLQPQVGRTGGGRADCDARACRGRRALPGGEGAAASAATPTFPWTSRTSTACTIRCWRWRRRSGRWTTSLQPSPQ